MSTIHPTRPEDRQPRRAHCKPDGPLSTSQLRRKTRDLTRLLSHAATTTKDGHSASPSSSLPPAARIEAERALEAYKHELVIAQQSLREKQLADKYRMVRFFG